MDTDPPMQLPYELHRYTGWVREVTTDVVISFPLPCDLWLNVEGATHFFLNRASRELYRATGKALDKNNVEIGLVIFNE